jgi:hypothetical protein
MNRLPDCRIRSDGTVGRMCVYTVFAGQVIDL